MHYLITKFSKTVDTTVDDYNPKSIKEFFRNFDASFMIRLKVFDVVYFHYLFSEHPKFVGFENLYGTEEIGFYFQFYNWSISIDYTVENE